MNILMVLEEVGLVLPGIGLFVLIAYVVMRLLNGLVPALVNGSKLRFIQALSLLFLTRLLSGFSFGPRGYGHRGFGRELYWQKHYPVGQKFRKRNTSQHKDSVYYHTQYKLQHI